MPYKDPEKNKEAIKQWHLAHVGYNYAAVKRWRKEHPEECKTANKKWHEKHPECMLESHKRWRDNHPEVMKQWRANHPESNVLYCSRRRARINGSSGNHTALDVAQIRAEQDNLCYYCGEPLGRSYHVDHKQPLSRGGSNDRSNLCCACPSCNLRKHDATESEFVLRQFAGTPCSA